tara:strand:- start:29 stop:301 length:273 start_codon:yes stop_codon:yes gene_type:complete
MKNKYRYNKCVSCKKRRNLVWDPDHKRCYDCWMKYREEQKRCEVETCDNVLEDGEGTTIYLFSDWGDVVCDDCNEQYKNGEWIPDVDVRH